MTSYIAPGNLQFSYAELEYIWEQAGGNAQAASIAAAIAMAESGGNSANTDVDSNGTVDRGLWQINSIHGAQSTYDVMGNARAAVSISNNGANWSAWTTYTSGAYQRYLQGSVTPSPVPLNATNAQANQNATLDNYKIPTLPGGNNDPLNWGSDFFNWATGGIPGIGSGGGGVAGEVLNPGQAIDKAISGMMLGLLDPIINLTAGVLGVAAGGIMVAFGIFTVVRQSNTGREATNVAGQAALTAVAPEASATTEYTGGASGTGITRVTQTRRPAGRIGGYQYRPARSHTQVTRPTKDTLRDQAKQYQNRSGGADE
jgi:Lysozyme like domain